MSPFARGPGSAVLRAGPVISFLLPSGARRSVFQQHALLGQGNPDPIGLGEVAALTRRLARLDHALALFPRDRWLLVLCTTQRHDAEHAIELIDRRSYQRCVVVALFAGIHCAITPLVEGTG